MQVAQTQQAIKGTDVFQKAVHQLPDIAGNGTVTSTDHRGPTGGDAAATPSPECPQAQQADGEDSGNHDENHKTQQKTTEATDQQKNKEKGPTDKATTTKRGKTGRRDTDMGNTFVFL